MKKLHSGALKYISTAAIAILTMVGCSGQNQNSDSYYNGYGYGGYYYYPSSTPRYMVMRQNTQTGQTDYASSEQAMDQRAVVNANYQPMNNGQQINQQNGYSNVNGNGTYFVNHSNGQYQDPYQNAQRQSAVGWVNNYAYSCGYRTGYYGFRGYCNTGWNHIYTPWYGYNNWAWRPTYYYNNNFWYYTSYWNQPYYWNNYVYYQYWLPTYSWMPTVYL